MRGTLARTTSALEDHKKSCLDPDHRPESDLTVSSSTIEKMFEIYTIIGPKIHTLLLE